MVDRQGIRQGDTEAQHELQEYQRFLSTLISNLPGMVYRCRNDPAWTMDYVSEGSVRLTGYLPADLMNSRLMSYNNVIHPGDRGLVWDAVERAVAEHRPFQMTYRIVTASGHVKWVWEQGRMVENGGLEGFITDITERREDEEALRRSEARLDSIFRSAPTGIGMVINRIIREANQKLCEMTGYAREELLDHSARLFYATDEEFDRVGQVKYDMIEEGGVGVVETRWRRKDGTMIDVLLSSSPIEPADLSAGVTFTALDISRRKRSDEELARLASIVMSSDDAILSKRLDGTITSWNRGAEHVYGYRAAEVVGHSVDVIVPPERSQELRDILRRIGRGERIEHYETERLTRDRRRIIVSMTISPIFDASGRVVGASTIARDITEQKQAERALKKSQYILAKSQEMALVGNWAWNVRTGEFNGSDENYRIFGFLPAEAEHSLEWVLSCVHPDDLTLLSSLMESARHDGKRGSVDYRIVRPDGSMRYVNTLADKIVRDRAGKVKWVYGITQDITERKQTEKALEEAKARAELYIDLMGHDINNMNQVALGFLEMSLDDPGMGEETRKALSKSLESIRASSRLIHNVRKLQQIKTGGKSPTETDVDHVLRQVQAAYSKVPGTAATIRYSPATACCPVMADELLYDVFANMTENAIKHAKQAPVVDIRLGETEVDGRKYCRVSIEDNGPGIPDDMKQAVFGRMRRGDTKAKGSGLGLYLVKTLVGSYGGQVWVEDRVPGDRGHGCRFVVLLPAV
ncbi:MAG TPA: PAS domain S-box protein [Methanocella sp.]|jgi:PAS domain S-box-containing protein